MKIIVAGAEKEAADGLTVAQLVIDEKVETPQYVTVTIETPRNLNKEQKEALRKFSETLGESNYEKRKSFFKKK